MNFLWKILLFLSFLFADELFAKNLREGWIFSPLVGVNQLALDSFHDTVYKSPFVGRVRITSDVPEDIEGAASYPTQEFRFDNSLKARVVDVEAGIEMRRSFGTRNDFFIGIGAWETTAETNDLKVIFPLQGVANNRALYSRRSKLSYTQYYLGMRHYLNDRGNKFNLFLNMSIREIFDIDYEETNVFRFISGAPAGFQRIFIYKSQGTGLLMAQFGLGGEYRFADRFSIGLEGSYSFHIKDGNLTGVNFNSDVNDGDGFDNGQQPLIISPINNLLEAGALSEDGESRNKVNLRFDGWHVVMRFNVAF